MLLVLWIFFGKLQTVTKSTQFQYLILPSLTSNCDLQIAGNNSTENYFIITSNLVGDRNNHYEDTGQPPPPALVRDTILQQDAQFREQVGGQAFVFPTPAITFSPLACFCPEKTDVVFPYLVQPRCRSYIGCMKFSYILWQKCGSEIQQRLLLLLVPL